MLLLSCYQSRHGFGLFKINLISDDTDPSMLVLNHHTTIIWPTTFDHFGLLSFMAFHSSVSRNLVRSSFTYMTATSSAARSCQLSPYRDSTGSSSWLPCSSRLGSQMRHGQVASLQVKSASGSWGHLWMRTRQYSDPAVVRWFWTSSVTVHCMPGTICPELNHHCPRFIWSITADRVHSVNVVWHHRGLSFSLWLKGWRTFPCRYSPSASGMPEMRSVFLRLYCSCSSRVDSIFSILFARELMVWSLLLAISRKTDTSFFNWTLSLDNFAIWSFNWFYLSLSSCEFQSAMNPWVFIKFFNHRVIRVGQFKGFDKVILVHPHPGKESSWPYINQIRIYPCQGWLSGGVTYYDQLLFSGAMGQQDRDTAVLLAHLWPQQAWWLHGFSQQWPYTRITFSL